MTIPFATRVLFPVILLALLAACDRPKGPPPPKATAAGTDGQAAPSNVALSGSILDPQPNAAAAKPATPATGATKDRVARDDRPVREDADPQALRDFQAEQDRRDRELLDQDLSEAQLRAREDAWDRERASAALDESEAAPHEVMNEDRETYELPREDGDWSPSDELPPDEELSYDEPPYEDPPYDDEAGLDDGYDPRDGAYRP